MYDLRKAIECQAIQLAIEHLPESELLKLQEEIRYAEEMIGQGINHHFFQSDTTFHGTILKFCNNTRIQDVSKTIDSHMRWFRVITATAEERMFNSSRRHKQILKALFDRNRNIARDLIELHIEEVKIDMLNDSDRANSLHK
jgi:DNA-binding GntR family transcriptional regulator